MWTEKVRLSRTALIKAWADPRPLDIIAAEFGITGKGLSAKAHRAGLPARKSGPKKVGIGGAEFARLWTDGVRTKDLIALYRCDHLAPARHARRLGLEPRGRGWIPKMTLADWKAQQLAACMAADAAAGRAEAKRRAA